MVGQWEDFGKGIVTGDGNRHQPCLKLVKRVRGRVEITLDGGP